MEPRTEIDEDLANAESVSEGLIRALKAVKIYESAKRLSTRQSVESLFIAVKVALAKRNPFELAVRSDRLLLLGRPAYTAQPGIADDLLRSLFASGVRAIRFRDGTKAQELSKLIEVLALSDSQNGGDIAARLWDIDLPHIEFDIVDDLVEVEGASTLPPEVNAAIEAAEKTIARASLGALASGAYRVESGTGAGSPPAALNLGMLESAVGMAGPEALVGDEGLEATVLRAGEIAIDALARDARIPPQDAAYALGSVARENVRRKSWKALFDLVATVRSLAVEGPPNARAAAGAMLDMLAPGEYLEPVLYELIRFSELDDPEEFDDLLERVQSRAPDALARLWLVIESPEQKARVKQRLLAAVAADVTCLAPLTRGDFGADAARMAVDLVVEACTPAVADKALKQIADDTGANEAARARASVRLASDAAIQSLVARLRAPERTERAAVLRALETSAAGTDAARNGLEAFLKDRAFMKLDQDEMNAVARTLAVVADLRAVRVLTEIAEAPRRVTSLFYIGAGSANEAAKKGLAFLKELRSKARPAVAPEVTEAFEEFSRLLLQNVGGRPRSGATRRG